MINYLNNKPLDEYVPQTGFLSLMMTGDGASLGTKFGITFMGKWVWTLKDYIDMSFMNLFNPKYLFKDYETKGTAEPLDNFTLFDDDDATEKEKQLLIAQYKERTSKMDPKEAGELLSTPEEDTEYLLKWQILTRMHWEQDWRNEVVQHFKPPYKLE